MTTRTMVTPAQEQKTKAYRAAAKAGEELLTIEGYSSQHDAAEAAFATLYPMLDSQELYDVAERGFNVMLNSAMSRLRAEAVSVKREETWGSTPDARQQRLALADKIHERIACIFTHSGNKTKMRDCVETLMALPLLDRDAAIEKRLAQNMEVHDERQTSEAQRTAEMSGAILAYAEHEVRKARLAILQSINWVSADGTAKTLDQFTLADLASAESKADSQETAWGLRKGWFGDAANHVREVGAETVGDLGDPALETLSGSAKGVWKK